MIDSSGLTLKQRKFIKLYLECGNATEAAMQVYDCKDRDSAKQIGYENLTKLDYSILMEEAGITDKYLQEKILEGLDANRTISAFKGKTATGTDNDFIDVPDFMARHKYLETALKLKKRLNDKLDMPQGQVVNINVLMYGHNDPMQFRARETEPSGDPRFATSSTIPSAELASESKKNNTGS